MMESLGLEDASKRLAEHVHPKRRNKQQLPVLREWIPDQVVRQC